MRKEGKGGRDGEEGREIEERPFINLGSRNMVTMSFLNNVNVTRVLLHLINLCKNITWVFKLVSKEWREEGREGETENGGRGEVDLSKSLQRARLV
jgi:hypothetical protein